MGLLPGASPAKSETAATPSPLTRSSHDPAARLPEGDSASEYWDVTIKLDSGHHIVARFIITNVGFGDRNGIAFGHLVHPDGSRVAFRNGKLQGRWRLTGNDQNLDIGGCHLFMEANPYRFWINKDDVKIDLRFAPNFASGDARRCDTGWLPLGCALTGLHRSRGRSGFGDEAAPRSVDGEASLVHTWTRENEVKQVTRRIDFYGFQPEPSFVVTFLAPSGPQAQWLAAPSEEGTWRSTTQFDANPVGHLDGLEREGYLVPRRVELTGAGAAGQIQLSQTVLEADPLGGPCFSFTLDGFYGACDPTGCGRRWHLTLRFRRTQPAPPNSSRVRESLRLRFSIHLIITDHADEIRALAWESDGAKACKLAC